MTAQKQTLSMYYDKNHCILGLWVSSSHPHKEWSWPF